MTAKNLSIVSRDLVAAFGVFSLNFYSKALKGSNKTV